MKKPQFGLSPDRASPIILPHPTKGWQIVDGAAAETDRTIPRWAKVIDHEAEHIEQIDSIKKFLTAHSADA